MKNITKFILGIVLSFAISTSAYAVSKTIPLAWDYGDDSMLACFTIYAAKASPIVYEARDVAQWSYDVSPTARTTSITVDMNEGDTLYIVATASSDSGGESIFSNQVTFFLPIPPPPVVIPKAPSNLRVAS